MYTAVGAGGDENFYVWHFLLRCNIVFVSLLLHSIYNMIVAKIVRLGVASQQSSALFCSFALRLLTIQYSRRLISTTLTVRLRIYQVPK